MGGQQGLVLDLRTYQARAWSSVERSDWRHLWALGWCSEPSTWVRSHGGQGEAKPGDSTTEGSDKDYGTSKGD